MIRKIIWPILLFFILVGWSFGLAETSGSCGKNATWVLDNNGLLTISGTGEIDSHPWTASEVKQVVIQKGITRIGVSSFRGCKNLVDITIPDSVTVIGERAFQECISLTSIKIPEGVTSINEWTFYNCSNLMRIECPQSVTSIGGCAFWKCANLKSFTIPENVTSIGGSAFLGCSSLTSIIIPGGITSIESYVFSRTSITSIIIPTGVTSIGTGAFYLCNHLASITIPETVTSIGANAFYSCESLTSLTIPKGITSIENSTFDGCRNLPSISLPEGLTRIGESAFQSCYNLKSITIPESVTSIGNKAFYACGLTSITIPEGVSIIGPKTFARSWLEDVTIPDSVTTIGESAFEECDYMKNVTIPEGITSIGAFAFNGCKNLKDVIFFNRNTDSVLIDSRAFGYISPTVYCYEYSYVDSWASGNSYPIVYLDTIEMDSIRQIVLPADFMLISGETKQLPIYIFPNDNPNIMWTSSNPSIVAINNGIITTIEPGTATVTAFVGSTSATVHITVYVEAEAFDINIEEAWLVAKENTQLSVENIIPIGSYVDINWSSSDSSIATVDQNGFVKTYRPGDIIVSADTKTGVHRECLLHICYPVTSIDLEPINETIVPGKQIKLIANVTMQSQSCVNHLLTFSSSDESIVTIDENGIIHILDEGEAIITAKAASGVTRTITLLVNHDWGVPVYEWSADFRSVTARRFCKCNVDHTEEETTLTIEEIIVAPSCTEKGMANYTSIAFQNPAFVPQRMEQVELVELGHSWSEPTYTWNERKTHVTASKSCKRDANHCETETADVETIVISPTEIEKGQVVYNAQFSNSGFLAQERKSEIPALKDMTVIKIPEQMKTIEEEAFVGISSQAIIIPETCERIGQRAFANCSNLIYILIPARTDVAEDAFEKCEQIVVDKK